MPPMDEDLPERVRRSLDAFLPRVERRGYLTYDELNVLLLPWHDVTSRRIEAVMQYFTDCGIDIVEH